MAGGRYIANDKMTLVVIGNLAPARISIPRPECSSGGPRNLPRRHMVESVVGSHESFVDTWRCEIVLPWAPFLPSWPERFLSCRGQYVANGKMIPVAVGDITPVGFPSCHDGSGGTDVGRARPHKGVPHVLKRMRGSGFATRGSSVSR